MVTEGSESETKAPCGVITTVRDPWDGPENSGQSMQMPANNE